MGFYEAIRDVLGEQKFNGIFGPNSPSRLQLHFNSLKSPLRRLYQQKPPESLRSGNFAYFGNVGEYSGKHFNGESVGFCTICCNESPQLFTTLGLSPAGMTKEEIGEALREEFNRPAVGMSIASDGLARRISYNPLMEQALRDKTMSKAEFSSKGGGSIRMVFELNAERIAQLATASFQEACDLYASWSN
jgi:hypothetical protein